MARPRRIKIALSFKEAKQTTVVKIITLLRRNGESLTRISDILNLSTGHIAGIINTLKIPKTYIQKPVGTAVNQIEKPPTNARDNELLLLRKQGYTHEQIGDIMGITRERVRQICANHGVPRANIRTIGIIGSHTRITYCQACGKPFPFKKRQKNCSSKCGGSDRITNTPMSHNTVIILTCDYCGNSFERLRHLQTIALKNCKPGKKNYCNHYCAGKGKSQIARRKKFPWSSPS